jgi:ferritin
MLKAKIEAMIVDQMNFEFYSAYIYMSMAAYVDSIDLPGCAHWFKIQVQEEMAHALKMYNYLLSRGGRPYFSQVPAPKKDWASVQEVFKDALAHEMIVTDRINKLMTAAVEEHDHASRSFINWYVDEQVEEEANLDVILKKFDLIKGSVEGLFMIDKDLAARIFTMPLGVTI